MSQKISLGMGIETALRNLEDSISCKISHDSSPFLKLTPRKI
jgi:hypothetical protein